MDRTDQAEQRLLMISLVAVAVMAAASLTFGLWSRSRAITFDGFYNLADAGMTWLALRVVRLIRRGDDARFQYGYWHFEPLLGLVNGLILALTCAYAFADGLNGLLTGGHAVELGPGALFTGVSAVASLAIYLYMRRASAGLASDILQVNLRSWLMGAALSTGLCLGFLVAVLLRGVGAAHLAPLVDPIVLVVVALALLPFPVLTLIRSGQDILQMAPTGLSEQVGALTRRVAARHGFKASAFHVARTGRQLFVEVGLAADSGDRVVSFQALDEIRAEISTGLGRVGPGCWLTVDFTADPRWIATDDAPEDRRA
jgi:cation diffusion facilitator family transporter